MERQFSRQIFSKAFSKHWYRRLRCSASYNSITRHEKMDIFKNEMNASVFLVFSSALSAEI
jgi:hypothetical protein